MADDIRLPTLMQEYLVLDAGTDSFLQQLPVGVEEPVSGDRVGDGLDLPVERVIAIGRNDYAGGILELHLPIPGIPDEPAIVFILGQVAVVVVGGCHRAADRYDLVLLVGTPGLGDTVGCDASQILADALSKSHWNSEILL